MARKPAKQSPSMPSDAIAAENVAVEWADFARQIGAAIKGRDAFVTSPTHNRPAKRDEMSARRLSPDQRDVVYTD